MQMNPRDTRIPEEPDQLSFLTKWFDYHRGYTIVKRNDDGVEETRELLIEKPWTDVAPGHLPVLQEEERIQLDSQRPRSWSRAEENPVSLDATLDSLLEVAIQEEVAVIPRQEEQVTQLLDQSRPMAPAYDAAHYAERMAAACNQIEAAEKRREEAQQAFETAKQELRESHQRRSQISREVLAARHLERVFGTREEIRAQGSSYVSPLTSLFNRAYDRYRVAEEVRAEERVSNELLEHSGDQRVNNASMNWSHQSSWQNQEQRNDQVLPPIISSLDDELIVRPPPLTEQEMTIKIACKICLQQLSDTAVLPCGHMIMCSHCAAIAVPSRSDDVTQPIRRTLQCPLCRKTVKRIVRIFTS